METQRLETVSQPHHSCPPVPPHLWLSSFLPSSSPLSPPLLLPTSLCRPIPAPLSSLPLPPSLSLPQLTCPAAPRTAPSLQPTGDSGKGAEGRREAQRPQLAARQPRGETFRQRKASLTPHSSRVQQTLSPHLYDYARESGRKKRGSPFPEP